MPKDAQILAASDDRKLVVATACEFAASDSPADHATLLRFLDSRQFLLRLDTEEDYYRQRARRLRVARVVKTLVDSPHAAAKSSLVALARGREFRSFELLQELLVRALAAVRPSPPEAVAFWESHAQPDSDNLHLVVEAIFENGSAPALALFEKMIADPRQEEECRIIWLRDPMLRHRNDEAVLACCERMIVQGTVPGPMRVTAVEALCDYDRDWYLACKKPRPPARVLAPRKSREILQRIGTFALGQLPLEPSQQAAVRTALAELDLDHADRYRSEKPR